MCYPIDLSGIKEIGVTQWLENYYIPIKGKVFQDVHTAVLNSYVTHLGRCNNKILYWLMIANLRVAYKISVEIFEFLRLMRLKEDGFDYVMGKRKEDITDLLSSFDFSSLYPKELKATLDNKTVYSFQERATNVLRLIKYNSHHIYRGALLRNIRKPVFFTGYMRQGEVVEYCKWKEIYPIQLPPLLFTKSSSKGNHCSSHITEVYKFINEIIISLGKEFSMLSNSFFDKLSYTLCENLKYSLICFLQNLAVFERYKPRNLLSNSLGYLPIRLFSAAWRCAGGDITGFTHGNSYTHSYSPYLIFILSLVSRYVVNSEGQKKILSEAVKDFSYLPGTQEIVNLPRSRHLTLFNKLQKDNPVKKIKNVVVVGFPKFDFYGAWLPEYHLFSQLHLELKLLEAVKAAGYYTIYKPHPMTHKDVECLFEGYVDEIECEAFEDMYKKADCLLLPNPHSTTFGFSLLTNKPMVLVNTKGYIWFPEVFELIKKRCSVVDAEPVDGKINFDSKSLVDAIESSLNNINYDVLYECAF